MDNLDLITKLEGGLPSMSKGQKRIAAYILDNYDKAAFMTAGSLGRTVGVSESTVVRFACAMGYDGYPKLQKHLQEIIKNKLTNVQRLGLMEGMNSEEIIDTVFKQDRQNLRATREMLDIPLLEDIVELMVNARNVYVIGFRSSAPLTQFFVYYLSYILDNIKYVTQGSSDIYAQLIHAGAQDVVVGMGFPRYSMLTVNGLSFAKSKNAKIIAITDNKMSPLYELADRCILTKNDMNSFVDSLVAPLSIINTLIIMLGLRKKDELVSNFIEMENVWKEHGIYARDSFIANDVMIDDVEEV